MSGTYSRTGEPLSSDRRGSSISSNRRSLNDSPYRKSHSPRSKLTFKSKRARRSNESSIETDQGLVGKKTKSKTADGAKKRRMKKDDKNAASAQTFISDQLSPITIARNQTLDKELYTDHHTTPFLNSVLLIQRAYQTFKIRKFANFK